MQTIHTLQEAGPDKTLQLTIPVDEAHRRYRITVLIEPEQSPTTPPGPEDAGWPPSFIAAAGSIQDDTFMRPPQGEYERRSEFDS